MVNKKHCGKRTQEGGSIAATSCRPESLFSQISVKKFHYVNSFFSSTGRRPASYCHGIVSVVRPFVRACECACVRKLFLQKTSPQKLLTGFLRNFSEMFLRWSSFKFIQIIVFYEEFWLPWRSK